MNTRILMTASALFLGLTSVGLTFMPDLILEGLNQDENPVLLLAFQLGGALYFGFAILNYMAKGVLIGGIYSRPLALGNFSHFLIGAFASLKTLGSIEENYIYWLFITIAYCMFAILFGYVFMTNPKPKK